MPDIEDGAEDATHKKKHKKYVLKTLEKQRLKDKQWRILCLKIMLAFLLPLASKIISDAVAKIPENEELGEKLVEICLIILGKAVKLTKTDMDDQLLEVVKKAMVTREEG